MRRGIKKHFLEKMMPELKVKVSITRQMRRTRGDVGCFQQRGWKEQEIRLH